MERVTDIPAKRVSRRGDPSRRTDEMHTAQSAASRCARCGPPEPGVGNQNELARAPLTGWSGHTCPPPGRRSSSTVFWSFRPTLVQGFHAPAQELPPVHRTLYVTNSKMAMEFRKPYRPGTLQYVATLDDLNETFPGQEIRIPRLPAAAATGV